MIVDIRSRRIKMFLESWRREVRQQMLCDFEIREICMQEIANINASLKSLSQRDYLPVAYYVKSHLDWAFKNNIPEDECLEIEEAFLIAETLVFEKYRLRRSA